MAGEISRRDFLKLSGAFFFYGMWNAAKPILNVVCPPPVIWHGNRRVPAIALTFDDCYNFEALVQLKDLLETRPLVKVTFFPVGRALLNTTQRDPLVWEDLLDSGHEIGYHGYSHEPPSSLSTRRMVDDFDRWMDALYESVNGSPHVRFARPPFGDVSRSFLNLCCERGLYPVLWSANWGASFRKIQNRIQQVQNGDIVILHVRHLDLDTFSNALSILDSLKLRCVTLSELILSDFKDGENGEELLCDTKNNKVTHCVR